MARRKSRRRRSPRRTVRRVARRTRRVARKAAPRRRRRRATMSGTRKRRRRVIKTPARKAIPRMAGMVGAGVGGGIGAAALVNALPIADNRSKSLAAMGAGLLAYMVTPKRNRLLRAASVGATLGGALALTKQMFPNVPLLAGAEPYMGINMRPTYPQIANTRIRQSVYDRNRDRAFNRATESGRNSQFMGYTGPSFTTGQQYAAFRTPADM